VEEFTDELRKLVGSLKFWIATSLLGVPKECGRSYGWGETDKDDYNSEGVTVEPLVSLKK
jgi:hypothetical protein